MLRIACVIGMNISAVFLFSNTHHMFISHIPQLYYHLLINYLLGIRQLAKILAYIILFYPGILEGFIIELKHEEVNH